MKKVVIKIHDDGAVEVISKDPDVAVVLQYPDDSEVEVFEGDKKIRKDGEWGGRLGINRKSETDKELSADIRNKLQAGKTALEAFRDGRKVPNDLIKIAIKDLDSLIKLLN